jgi:hypothetical protein
LGNRREGMKIKYKTTICDSKEYRQVGEPEFCCPEMKVAWGEAIVFGKVDYNGEGNRVHISRCHPYPEGACWDAYAVDFCPFCGEKIECEEVEVVRMKKVVHPVTVLHDEWVKE